MRHEDVIDFTILDLETKASFGLLDWFNKQKREYKQLTEKIKAFRLENPTLFDQMLIIGLAAVVEIIASYAKRQ